MPNLRQWIDSGLKIKPVEETQIKEKDQVYITRQVGRGMKASREVLRGKVLQLVDNGEQAIVTMARAGGKVLRTQVPVSQLRAATSKEKFSR